MLRVPDIQRPRKEEQLQENKVAHRAVDLEIPLHMHHNGKIDLKHFSESNHSNGRSLVLPIRSFLVDSSVKEHIGYY